MTGMIDNRSVCVIHFEEALILIESLFTPCFPLT